jgi:hypothetical protein
MKQPVSRSSIGLLDTRFLSAGVEGVHEKPKVLCRNFVKKAERVRHVVHEPGLPMIEGFERKSHSRMRAGAFP